MSNKIKKFFIYQDEKGTNFCAKTKKCKTIGRLVGEFRGYFVEEPTTMPTKWENGSVVSLINDQRVKVIFFNFYNDL